PGNAAQRLRLRVPSRVDGSALRSGEAVSLSFAPHEGHLVLA
ncbi:ABC transporter ATP-binding protein, partial [Mesorhizobium sp. M7A.F.Ca.US.007.01.1.1]